MKTNIIKLETAVAEILLLTKQVKANYICLANVHMCMETFDSPSFRKVVNSADLVIPDGRPIAWTQKTLGFKNAEQVRGQDLMSAICQQSNSSELTIGFYGGSSEKVLLQMKSSLQNKYNYIRINYSFSPPFRPLTNEEDQQVINSINSSKIDILFVGTGCPKQEMWMASHQESLNCVMIGVGAAFDFIAGEKKHAPKLLQKMGLEWLFRLICEPKRLSSRYLKQNPRFIYYFIKSLFSVSKV